MTCCPCCEYTMVQRFHHHHKVWFCRHCWQEMPDLETQRTYSLFEQRSLERLIQKPVQPLILAS